MMRPTLGGMALVALLVGTSAAAQSPSVTLTLGQYRNVNKVTVLVFSGTVANGAAGEEVEVVGRDCGGTGYRLIAGATTRTGGGWQVENPSPTRWTPYDSGITFRARWKEQLSNPVVWRTSAFIWVVKLPGRRAWKVHVDNRPGHVSLDGELVELQRRVDGGWVRYRKARLRRKASLDFGAFNHEAVFDVPGRGLRLRAVLPSRSAAPCFLASASTAWRS